MRLPGSTARGRNPFACLTQSLSVLSHARTGAQELFSLSRATSSPLLQAAADSSLPSPGVISDTDDDDSEDSKGGSGFRKPANTRQREGRRGGNSTTAPLLGSGSETGNEGEDGTGTLVAEFLSGIQCAACNKSLTAQQGRQKRGGSGGDEVDPGSISICDGCHRCFHASCCAKKQLGVEWSGSKSKWFHCMACATSYASLSNQMKEGPLSLPCGRSIQVVGTRIPSSAASPKAIALQGVVSLLAVDAGPDVFENVESSDFCLLLRDSSGLAVAAAAMELLGPDYGKVDLIATLESARNQGHCRALLGGLELLLRNAGTAKIMLVTHDLDLGSNEMWQSSFGFEPLRGRQLKKLKSQIPQLGCCPDGQTLLVRPVPKHAAPLVLSHKGVAVGATALASPGSEAVGGSSVGSESSGVSTGTGASHVSTAPIMRDEKVAGGEAPPVTPK
ncbi:MAG: hypothetical protein WDW38_009121 [Sanguina aurantia]